ncbi:Axonemal dynein light chain domain-containing protein 1 [Podochytrium sp. JEL0797]|nr:Axonemal dynein light chain domain-containing protein 1 [Podochytrium sp. JEL0797]
MIPTHLLSQVKKLADKEKGIASSSSPPPQHSLPRNIPRSQLPPQNLSTRTNKGFNTQKQITPLPTFNSSSDVFQMNQPDPPLRLPPTTAANPSVTKRQPPTLLPTQAAPENAFTHHETAKRVAHLKDPGAGPSSNGAADLAFLYETPGRATTPNSHGIRPEDFSMVVPNNPKKEDVAQQHYYTEDAEEEEAQVHVSLKPTTRKEVALLKHTMVALLNDIGCSVEKDYPTDMHAFLAMIQEEQKIYDTVFQELIRQVTINMLERGEVLSEIRRRYGQMFTKIPKHVKHLHTELIAQRKLNRRLCEELMRSKETVSDLWGELNVVRKHDMEVTKQAQDAQEKLISVLTQSDNTDEILEEYHKLYKMQRERLEEGVRKSEQEKKVWIDAAQNLALRIGHEHGLVDLAQLQKTENSRLRSSNHMIVIISNTNDSEMTAIEQRIEEWRTKLLKLSQTVIDDDHQNIETLTKIQRSMKLVLKNLTVNEPKDAIESDHPLLKNFHLFDVKSLSEHLMKWVEYITSVAIRFTSDSDLVFQEEITAIRKIAEQWLEASLKLLHRNEKNTNSKDYIPLSDVLAKIGLEIEEWLTKLEKRISGEEGVATLVIALQNQLEDRYTSFSARDFDKPLPTFERNHLKGSLVQWTEQLVSLTETLSNTCEKEQQKVPLHVENWISRILDQMNTDTDVRNEENHKLHTLMISWMVHLLVKSGKERPTEAWDHEFLQLTQEIMSFNMNLLRDSSDIEMISDDDKDLRVEIQLTKRLLAMERKNALRIYQQNLASTAARKSTPVQ